MTDKAASIRKAAVLLLFLTVTVPDSRLHFSDESAPRPFRESEDGIIRCIIDTGNDMYASGGLTAGFCHEMLTRFAGANGCTAKIALAQDGSEYEDSLIYGKIDILVRKAGDTTASRFIKGTCSSADCIWYLRSDRNAEIKEINTWLGSASGNGKDPTDGRYSVRYDPFKRTERGIISQRLSPYDKLIRKYASAIDWDWRMLAAVIYQESKFSISARSGRGASGLMQILPRTAGYYGVTDLLDPEQNIMAGTKHLARLQKAFPPDEFSPEDRTDFTLAAYNAGEGRIADCRHLAESEGLDSTKWENIVKIIPSMRTYSIGEDESARQGQFMGDETIAYIGRVREIYDAFCRICPE